MTTANFTTIMNFEKCRNFDNATTRYVVKNRSRNREMYLRCNVDIPRVIPIFPNTSQEPERELLALVYSYSSTKFRAARTYKDVTEREAAVSQPQ